MQAAELKGLAVIIFIPLFNGKTSQQRIEQVTFDIMQTTNQPLAHEPAITPDIPRLIGYSAKQERK